jgi:hypothetical protein
MVVDLFLVEVIFSKIANCSAIFVKFNICGKPNNVNTQRLYNRSNIVNVK